MLNYLTRVGGLLNSAFDADFKTVLLFSLIGLTAALAVIQSSGADVSAAMIYAG